jgi:hypothetical protein
MIEDLEKRYNRSKVVVPIRMTPEEREHLNSFYKKSVYKSRSDYILAVLKKFWQD